MATPKNPEPPIEPKTEPVEPGPVPAPSAHPSTLTEKELAEQIAATNARLDALEKGRKHVSSDEIDHLVSRLNKLEAEKIARDAADDEDEDDGPAFDLPFKDPKPEPSK